MVTLGRCISTRGVHLDAARDMTAESFLSIFHRLCGTWSVPKQVIDDNGTNFKANTKSFLQCCSW
ncbi:hypothetical protein SK128_025957 [Halocaridina rubra]|uniref:Integrase catalytic domain-containing protein n=1 Tax=Halocaridina rubra TaxID=373956 RepID=A0AAN8ZR34_HALRR